MRHEFMSHYFPHFLAGSYLLFSIALGINPVSREVWLAEIIPVIVVFLGLVVTFRQFRFSNVAYGLIFIWIFWHTVGGHYTFANVPFGWVSELLDSERNHFDRIGHFAIGFYAYAMMEFLLRKKHCSLNLAITFSLFFIMSVAAGYEIIEWGYAAIEGGDAGIEFLGSQGDVWDAQKDMLADTLGAIVSLTLYCFVRPDKKRLG